MRNKLINLTKINGTVVVSSREIAKDFGKQHSKVIRSIESLIEGIEAKSGLYFIESDYVATNGKSNKEYLMNRDGFSLLVMGFTGTPALQWKLKYIEAFNKMEEQIKNNVPKLNEKQQCILSIYEGGHEAIVGAKKLAEIEVMEVIEKLEPTIEEHKQFIECPDGCIFMDEYAKSLGIGRNRLYEILREMKILQTDEVEVEGSYYKGRRQNVPYQHYMEYFEVKFAVRNGRKFSVTLINNKGQSYIYKRLKRAGYILVE